MNNFIFLVVSAGIFQLVSAAPSLHNLDQQQCAPSAITFGQGNGGSEVTVTPSDFTTIGSTSTLKATCTADPGYIAWMTIQTPNGIEYATLENNLPSINISLNCSSATGQWTYSGTVGGQVYTVNVAEVKCQQTLAWTTKCLKSAITFGRRNIGYSAIDVTPSNYLNDGFSHASINASCTSDPGYHVWMTIRSQGTGEVAPLENPDMGSSVEIALSCSYDTDKWTYSAPAFGKIYTFEVESVQCLQADFHP